MLDTLIRNGTVVDGTGAAGVRADVAIQDGRVVTIGRVTATINATSPPPSGSGGIVNSA